ncbi:MAG: hypothetical protein ACRCX8_12865 [Sarcina sp.]
MAKKLSKGSEMDYIIKGEVAHMTYTSNRGTRTEFTINIEDINKVMDNVSGVRSHNGYIICMVDGKSTTMAKFLLGEEKNYVKEGKDRNDFTGLKSRRKEVLLEEALREEERLLELLASNRKLIKELKR